MAALAGGRLAPDRDGSRAIAVRVEHANSLRLQEAGEW